MVPRFLRILSVLLLRHGTKGGTPVMDFLLVAGGREGLALLISDQGDCCLPRGQKPRRNEVTHFASLETDELVALLLWTWDALRMLD